MRKGQTIAGEWLGIGAESLGLNGKVREADFLALLFRRRRPAAPEARTIHRGAGIENVATLHGAFVRRLMRDAHLALLGQCQYRDQQY